MSFERTPKTATPRASSGRRAKPPGERSPATPPPEGSAVDPAVVSSGEEHLERAERLGHSVVALAGPPSPEGSADPVRRRLWKGAGETEWVDDRSNTSWLEEVGVNRYRNHYTGDIYRYHEASDQFQLAADPIRFFDPATDRQLDRITETLYLRAGTFYRYDGRLYQATNRRPYSFNLPQAEAIRSDQIPLQAAVRLDLYGLDGAQVESALYSPQGTELATGGGSLDRRGVAHGQPGGYRIVFTIWYAPGRSFEATYRYTVRPPTEPERLLSAYEVPIYLGSHWTTDRFDDDFSHARLKETNTDVAQLGEGLYLTDDEKLGLRAGWDAVKRHGGDAVVEWRIYKIKGVDLQTLDTTDMPHELNWREIPWRRDPLGAEVMRRYDTIDKPPAESERKINPRAFRKVEVKPGKRLPIKDNIALFQQIDQQIGEMIRSRVSKGSGSPP